MRLLFAITICCFGALLWVSLALARRIRRGQILAHRPKPVRNPATREFFETGEFRTPRPLHLDQEIFKQKPRRPLAEINLAFDRPASVVSEPAFRQTVPNTERLHKPDPTPIRPLTTAYATLFGQNVSITAIEASKESSIDARGLGALPTSAPVDFSRRIPPQPVRASGLRRRVDLSHFNKDFGDLTDPYTNALRGSGTHGPAAIDNRLRFER